MPDINGIPYVESTDLVSAYPAASQALAQEISDQLASKVDYALPTNAQTGTAYTFVAADAEKLTTASNGSAVTLTIPPQSSVTWADNTVLRVVNYGAGDVTVDGGSGVTVTNTASTIAQYQSAAAIRTGSDAWTLVPFAGGGVGNADFSDAATGTYTDSGKSYKYIDYTASGTLTITEDGLIDVVICGAGAGGGQGSTATYPGGGGAGGVMRETIYLTAATYTVTIGAGGAAGAAGRNGKNGASSSLGGYAGAGGGGGSGGGSTGGPDGGPFPGGCGGGGSGGLNGAVGTPGQGFAGANASGSTGGGGGGATAVGTTGGAGGAGYTTTLTNSSITLGAGGAYNSSTSGGANTGNGGGGHSSPGSGGSGRIIVRVET